MCRALQLTEVLWTVEHTELMECLMAFLVIAAGVLLAVMF